MGYVEGTARDQMMFTSLDMMVEPDSIVRVIDAFVDALDLEGMGFARSEPARLGRPAYDPRMLLKVYIFGYQRSVRSSRRLAHACRTDVEAMWLACGLEPDFRTIADFRKDNAACLKAVFREFYRRVMSAREAGFYSVDGTKVRASNAKDLCFTASKLDDRIAALGDRCDEYLRLLDEADGAEEAGLRERYDEALERKGRYEGYRSRLESSGDSQVALTDPDARLMKARGGFDVCYNVQAAVESSTHLIADFDVTSRPTDHGLLASTLAGVREEAGGVVECTADKGYVCAEDMAECLMEGIVPHVILPDGRESFELEVPYDPAGGDPASADPAQLAACLRAGVVPEAYAPYVASAEVVEKDEPVDAGGACESPYGTPEEMAARAAEGWFVRDPGRNVVTCPAGNLLRQKSIKRDGKIRYANKLACKRCPHREKCFKGKGDWKEVDFSKDELEKPSRLWGGSGADAPRRPPRPKERRTVVRIALRPDPSKTKQRMCLSEHPFGTVKRALGSDHFLMRGRAKATAEFALAALAYDMGRALGMMGFEGLMEAVAPGLSRALPRLAAAFARALARAAARPAGTHA